MGNYASFREVIDSTREQRRGFFKLVFGDSTGYLCIAYKHHTEKNFDEQYWLYPDQLDEMCASVDENCQNLIHAYFCVNLLTRPKRTFENVQVSTVAWVDLDKCNPTWLMVRPSISVQTSDKRWQGLWRLDSPVPVDIAEDISRRIAYFHKDQGADKGCWNRTRLFRIPYTPNYKYGDITTAPVVVVTDISKALFRRSDFEKYPVVEAFRKITEAELSEDIIRDGETADEILARYQDKINQIDLVGYYEEPEGSWSEPLWRLERGLAEAGLKLDEIFIVASAAKSNKYKRDGRPDRELLAECKKAVLEEQERKDLAPTATATIPELITDDEVRLAQSKETFVERYIRWASKVTDAAIQYHQAGAFIILSSIMASSLKLPTSFGTVAPNMWFYLCANTTLTRKTTSMNLAIDLLSEVNDEAIMATDGSVEGILSALSNRPGQSSIYLRDEFTGLLEAMVSKDYMAGMAESFTKLYDGGSIRRMLRKEEIKIANPVFIMFAGGPKTKTQIMLTEEHINTGFVPRFIFITADPDPSRIKPMGPPTATNTEERELLLNELFVLYDIYNSGRTAPQYQASLTDAAWIRYNKLESSLTKTALDAGIDHLTPVYDRLAKSILKAAMLIAGVRAKGEDVVVEEADIVQAIYYGQDWFKYVSEIVNGVGKSHEERLIDALMESIHNAGDVGITRAELMRAYKLDFRRMEHVMTTMEQRNMLRKIPWHGQYRYFEL